MTDPDPKPVLVVGGSRGLGMLIVGELVARGRRVRALVRDPAGARARLPAQAEIVAGDLTRAETLPPALDGAGHVIFTAGAPSGRYASGALVRATDFQGVVDTLAAARRTGFEGRFVYLDTVGVHTPSLERWLLNLLKRNTFAWRRRAEEAIRRSGLDYTIIRVPFLLDRPGGARAIEFSQGAMPLSAGRRIARADAAEVFVAALDRPAASRATFEIRWGPGPRRSDPGPDIDRLRPDGA